VSRWLARRVVAGLSLSLSALLGACLNFDDAYQQHYESDGGGSSDSGSSSDGGSDIGPCDASWCLVEFAPSGGSDLRAISGTGPDNLWAVGGTSSVMHRDADKWSLLGLPYPGSLPYAVWTPSPGVAYVSSYGATQKWEQGTWTMLTGNFVAAMHGAAGSALPYGVRGDTVYRFDGNDWVVEFQRPNWASGVLNAVWVNSSTDLWAVGIDNVVLHKTPNGYSSMSGVFGPTPSYELLSVWSADWMDAWYGGREGFLYRWDPVDNFVRYTWPNANARYSLRTRGIWGNGTRAWMTLSDGPESHLLDVDAASGEWLELPVHGMTDLGCMFAVPPDDIWVCGTKNSQIGIGHLKRNL
jgi:hypothetical protein